jgi:hypothetical protein
MSARDMKSGEDEALSVEFQKAQKSTGFYVLSFRGVVTIYLFRGYGRKGKRFWQKFRSRTCTTPWKTCASEVMYVHHHLAVRGAQFQSGLQGRGNMPHACLVKHHLYPAGAGQL